MSDPCEFCGQVPLDGECCRAGALQRAPSREDYHEALNGLWAAFTPEFRANADLFVVRRMVDVLMRGAATGLPISAALRAGDAKDTA